MLLHICHETRYAYTPVVETAQHMAHLRPLDTNTQTLLSYDLLVDPKPAQCSETRDVFGNAQTFFELPVAHKALRVVADSQVETRAPAAPNAAHMRLTWEQVREHFRYHAKTAWDPAAEFVFASPYVPRHDDFVTWARPSFGPGTPLLVAAKDLMERIFEEFTYESESTQVNTPALEALHGKRGVCQDFAHIMVACLRALGLPARYVSGYLLTEPPPGKPRLIGSDASHAWASVYLPPVGASTAGRWYDFDPTNNRAPGEDYVTLATGRDYSDVSPIRGVIHGGARHTLTVAVTVEPVEPVAAGLP
jgi:transglutaminase-like putative cysteine protease